MIVRIIRCVIPFLICALFPVWNTLCDEWTTYFPERYIRDIIEDNEGNIWITTGGSIFLFDGLSWNEIPPEYYQITSDDRETVSFSKDTRGALWIASPYGFIEYTDGEWKKHWISDINNEPSLLLTTAFYITPDNSIWYIYNLNRIGVYDIDNNEWYELPPESLPPMDRIHDVVFTKDGMTFLSTNRGLYYSFSGNKEWTLITSSEMRPLTGPACITPADSDHLWLGMGDGLILLDIDTYTVEKKYTVSDGLLEDIVQEVAVAPDGSVWIGNIRFWISFGTPFCAMEYHGGVSVLHNDTWNSYTEQDGLCKNNVNKILHSTDGKVWFATVCGLSRLKPDGTHVDAASPVPMIQISNYPNPFNMQTTITYTIMEDSNVSLAVYSISGQKVATLADGFMPAGTHAALFDGSPLASGVYLYRFEATGFAKTGKIVLMK